MALELDDLTRPLSRQEVQAGIYNALATVGVNTTTWKRLAVVRTIIVCVSAVIAAFTALIAAIARSGFLELSSGAWLTLVARYVYGVERLAATFASGTVTLVNSGGGVFAIDVGDLIVTSPSTGQSYRNAASFNLAAGQTLDVAVSCTQAGQAGTAEPNTITVLTTALPGVSVTNAGTLIGADEESDSLLRARAREKLGSLSPFGPWDAYSFAVRSALRADGSSVGVTRVRLAKDGYGSVSVYVANANGAIGSADDLALLNSEVQIKAEAQCVTATVYSATPKPVTVTYEAWAYNTSGRTLAQLQAAIAKAVGAFVSAQPIGGDVITTSGKLYRDNLRAAISAALPEVFHVDITSPADDVALSLYEVPTLAALNVTAIHQVAPPDGHPA